MTKETIQKEHQILQLKYAVLAVVVGICVGIVDTIFGRGLLRSLLFALHTGAACCPSCLWPDFLLYGCIIISAP